MMIQYSFHTVAIAIIKLFILMAIGYVIRWKNIIDDKAADMLSMLLIRVVFPALIISKIITHFSFGECPYWFFLPLCAIIFCLSGMAMALAIHRLFLRKFTSGKEFICGCGFQNSGYLPMTLIIFSFAGAASDKLLIYTFLFSAGFNIILWSFVPLFLSGKLKKGTKVKFSLSPPIIATMFSLCWVAVMGKGSMPPLVMDPVSQLGYAAFPLGMIVLGAYLYRYQAHDLRNGIPIVACVIIKLILFPALLLAVLMRISMDPYLKFFLFLEGTMPVAVTLVIIGTLTGADNKFFSGSIFYTHLIAIFSIPFWLMIFHAVM